MSDLVDELHLALLDRTIQPFTSLDLSLCLLLKIVGSGGDDHSLFSCLLRKPVHGVFGANVNPFESFHRVCGARFG